MSTLTGCGGKSVVARDATSVPLEPALTKQEVLDYYAEALTYDTIVSRNTKADINQYEVTNVTDEEQVKLIGSAYKTTESLLSKNTYNATEKSSRYLSETMFHYMKALLNDKKLVNPEVTSITQALGYYFVDVKYDIKPAEIGTFTDKVSLIGINGAFEKSPSTDLDSIDEAYMTNAINILEEYFETNKLDYVVEFNKSTGKLTMARPDEVDNDYTSTTVTPEITPEPTTNPVENEGGTESTEATEATETTTEVTETTETAEPPAEPTPEPKPQAKPDNKVGSKISVRRPMIDLDLFHSIVGSGKSSSYIPDLYHIYVLPSDETGVSGIGLYPSGAFGLSIFGFNRNELSGTCTLRYVYKEDLVDPSILTCENIYITYYDISSGFSANNNNIIPDFLKNEFSVLIDRADRVMINDDTTGLMSGNVFSDIGMAVLNGYKENYGNTLRQMSTLRRIISRDIASNAYLVEIESYVQEGDETADLYASYKDQVYAVIQQEGSQFVITDWMIRNRQLYTEPDIDPDAATAKRVVSLGLTGEVTDVAKDGANKVLADLYNASTLRVLTGPYTTSNGTKVEKGMYDCFNSNVEMLSTSKKEELNSHLRSLLVKYGTTTNATMNGKVTEWLGGTGNQVEFTTEEVITYQGRTDGTYMTCYYLMSCMEDVWVIDDIQILSQEDLSGDGLASVVSRITG